MSDRYSGDMDRSLSTGEQAYGPEEGHSNPDNAGEIHSPFRWLDLGRGSLAPDRVKSFFEPCYLVRPDGAWNPDHEEADGKCRVHTYSHLKAIIGLLEQSSAPVVTSERDPAPSVQRPEQRTLCEIDTEAVQEV